MRRRAPTHDHVRARAGRARIAACATVLALIAVLGAAVQRGDAATSGTVVGANVLSATSLDTSACSGGDLALAAAPPLTTVITPSDCSVTFGSSNDSSALRLMQADQRGAALTQFAGPLTTLQAAPQHEAVTMKSATVAWAAGLPRKSGDPAPLARTTDGGATWTTQTPCTGSTWLNDIEHVTLDTVVAAGSSNVVCRTTDGVNWSRITPSPSGVWRTVEMLPTGQGWIGGNAGRIATTTDGGATWSALPVPNATWSIFDISAASATRLYAVASDTASPNNVYALTSSDGGTTWSSFLIGNSVQGGWGSAVLATSTTSALVGTSYGTWRTTDTGATWSQVDTQGSLCLSSPNGAIVIAAYGGTFGFRRSTDGGATWTSLAAQPAITGQIRGCDTVGTTALLVGANDQHLYSTDSGASYTVATSSYRDQSEIAAWTGDHFVTVGDDGSIRRSTDGGTTITRPTSGTAFDLYDVETFGSGVALAVGEGGTIRRSTDGGASWSGSTSGTGASLTSIDRDPDGTAVYAVGATGTVLRSLDEGATWSTTSAPGGVTLWDVVTLSRTSVWVVGAGGTIHRSSDGGATWSTQTSGTTLTIHSIDSLDGVNAVATTMQDAGQQGHWLRTTDGGATWTDTATTGPGEVDLNEVRYLDPTTLVIGSDSAYRRSTDGGLTWTVVSNSLSVVSGLAPLDANSFLLAGQADAIVRVLPVNSYGDYALTTRDFSGAASTFGACLHTASGTTSTDWTPAGAGNCTAANVGAWQAVPWDASASRIARRSTSGTGTVDLRFGAKAGATQATGAYVAQLRFEVIAPG